MSAAHLRAALLAEAEWHRACLHMIERFGQFTPGSGDYRTRLALIEAALASPIPARPAGTISQEAGEQAIAKALCCKGDPCPAPSACPAEIRSHWARRNASFAYAAIRAAEAAPSPTVAGNE